MDKDLEMIFTPEKLDEMVKRLAGEIKRDYPGKTPVLVGALKGAFVFLSDLIRALEMPVDVDFIQTSSYGKAGTTPTGVLITRDVTLELKGRDVIIVDGIIDRGKTVAAVNERIMEAGAASVRVCALLERNVPDTVRRKADYVGTRLDDGFVVGYGMDYKERYRELKGIYILKNLQPATTG
jgi:hypoxanthine phosphoribosyltransferase